MSNKVGFLVDDLTASQINYSLYNMLTNSENKGFINPVIYTIEPAKPAFSFPCAVMNIFDIWNCNDSILVSTSIKTTRFLNNSVNSSMHHFHFLDTPDIDLKYLDVMSVLHSVQLKISTCKEDYAKYVRNKYNVDVSIVKMNTLDKFLEELNEIR